MGRSKSQASSKEILRLAVPAFFTLIAEPLFLLVDTAIIGHVGTISLAGLGVASAALLTVVNLCVFLAYSTTAAVARRLGEGDRRAALAVGVDGIWLALALGAVAAGALALWAEPICALFGASPEVLDQATTYLRISALGLAPMLVTLAATGLLRGLQDTTSPLVITTAGFSLNLVLNLVFILGLGWGIAGSAWGTVIAQWSMAVAYLVLVWGWVQREQVPLGFRPAGVLASASAGVALFIRTIALRAVLLLTTWVAAGLGETGLAAHQIAMTIWSFLAFALDALAIAAQALTGRWLGAQDYAQVRQATSLMLRWGTGYGLLLGAAVIAAVPVLPALFTADPAVRGALTGALLVVGAGQPISGAAFVLDGVLIGAGDGRWLARAQVGLLLCFVPVSLLVHGLCPSLVALWLAFTGFMTLRAATLYYRSRSDTWMAAR
ncbi:MAG: MATE family efflux transporter [Propionibacteriaceae bacterium]